MNKNIIYYMTIIAIVIIVSFISFFVIKSSYGLDVSDGGANYYSALLIIKGLFVSVNLLVITLSGAILLRKN